MLRLLDSPFIRRLREQMREDWHLLLGLALLAGGSDTLLLVLINESAADAMAGEFSLPRAIMFMSMLGIHVLTNYHMLRLAGVAMQQLVFGFRTRIFDRLMRVELPEYEKLGKAELQLFVAFVAGVPASGVIPPAAPPRRSRGGALTSSSGSYGRSCKGWAGSFPWFENHLNQTNHAQSSFCRS